MSRQPQREVHETFYLKTIDDITKNLKLFNNLVLCKKVSNNVKSTTASGVQKVAESYNRDQYLPQNVDRCFEVVSLPDRIVDIWGDAVSDIEVKVGDMVWVVYYAALNAKRILTDDGSDYRFIRYKDLVVAKRRLYETTFEWKDIKTYRHKYIMEDHKIYEVIPLNGFVLFSKIYEEVKTNIQLPDHLKKRVVRNMGFVNYAGKPIKYYVAKEKDYSETNLKVRGGDTIALFEADKYVRELEDPMFLSFNGDKRYSYIRRKYVAAVLKTK